MTQQEVYRLADSTALEPLINSWAVWSDLIAPVPNSLHVLNYQVKILNSYLKNPEIHVKACKNPKFLGGPFIDVPVERLDDIKALLGSIESVQGENIKFAQALTEFYDLLQKEAKGQSLEPYYEQVPDPLRGYVELLYDYFNHPIVRFIEGLLYDSPYYNKELQSLRAFQQKRDDFRAFFLSTPRLSQDDQVNWKVSFDSPQIDEFFKIDAAPQPLSRIRELLELSDEDEKRLLPLLSSEPHPPAEKWDGSEVRIRYFGHACVLIEWKGVAILTDPWISVMSSEREVDHLSYRDLPEKIDYVIITHGHHDHFSMETLLRLRHKIECLVVPRTFGLFYADPSLKLMAQKTGFKNVIELDSLESIPLPDGEILAVPFLGEHADLAHGKNGYIVRAGKEQILFAADSNCLESRMYRHIRKMSGPIQTVFLGMECVGAPLSWLYGALLPNKLQHSHDQSRRTKGSNSVAALNLLNEVGSNRVYIYAMGCEPWLQYGMGLGLTEDSMQLQEAGKVLSAAREQGFLEAARPFGKLELVL